MFHDVLQMGRYTHTHKHTYTYLFILFCPSQYNTYESLTHILSDMLHIIAPDHT